MDNDKDTVYEAFSKLEPPRDNIGEPPSSNGIDIYGGSLDSRMRGSPKLSDMQSADSRLFPMLEVAKEHIAWLQHVMVARITPEVYIPFRNIIVKHLIRKFFPDLDVPEAIIIAETALSIAIDGEGRIDELALFGRSSDNEDAEREKKNI